MSYIYCFEIKERMYDDPPEYTKYCEAFCGFVAEIEPA
jgi:hypothetical protein